uniref:Uncharacterized protein n=1 Tax=Xiphophorus couchianus TaxID=32473 RepID=A0A3B5L1M3_9TELE
RQRVILNPLHHREEVGSSGAAGGVRSTSKFPKNFPTMGSGSINKIRGYSKVPNQGNQGCFQWCTAQPQRWSHLFCALITCFLEAGKVLLQKGGIYRRLTLLWFESHNMIL